MNRAVAVARVHGAQTGLAALDGIKHRSSLEGYHLYHAIRGTFAAELGQVAAALVSFRQAGYLATLPAERNFIALRIRECEVANGASGQTDPAEVCKTSNSSRAWERRPKSRAAGDLDVG